MDWALNTTANHIELRDSFVTMDGQWLDILLHDGRAFRFRPGALIKAEAPLEVRTQLLNRLISIGIKNAHPAKADAEMNDTANADISRSDDSFSLGSAQQRDDLVFSQDPGTVNPAVNPAQTNLSPDDTDSDSSFSLGNSSSSFSTDSLNSAFANADADPEAASDALETNSLLPIIRNAAYFLRSHRSEDSMLYLPLTDFIAAGLVQDCGQTAHSVFYSQIADDYRDTAEILSDSILELRGITNSLRHALQLEIQQIAGAKVFSFVDPLNYESSWFFDLEMVQQIAANISHDHFDSLPLFVPAARSKLYIVFDNDPHLADFFQQFLEVRDLLDPIYPLPHTLSADGWREWIPFPDSRLAEILGNLRGKFRQEIYSEQVQQMLRWGNFGALKDYERETLASGEYVSNTIWRDVDRFGSIPDTDFITFVRESSPHPWESAKALRLSIRSHIAREIWAEGFCRDEKVWPPRWIVNGFPEEVVLEKLRDASSREF